MVTLNNFHKKKIIHSDPFQIEHTDFQIKNHADNMKVIPYPSVQ